MPTITKGQQSSSLREPAGIDLRLGNQCPLLWSYLAHCLPSSPLLSLSSLGSSPSQQSLGSCFLLWPLSPYLLVHQALSASFGPLLLSAHIQRSANTRKQKSAVCARRHAGLWPLQGGLTPCEVSAMSPHLLSFAQEGDVTQKKLDSSFPLQHPLVPRLLLPTCQGPFLPLQGCRVSREEVITGTDRRARAGEARGAGKG